MCAPLNTFEAGLLNRGSRSVLETTVYGVASDAEMSHINFKPCRACIRLLLIVID